MNSSQYSARIISVTLSPKVKGAMSRVSSSSQRTEAAFSEELEKLSTILNQFKAFCILAGFESCQLLLDEALALYRSDDATSKTLTAAEECVNSAILQVDALSKGAVDDKKAIVPILNKGRRVRGASTIPIQEKIEYTFRTRSPEYDEGIPEKTRKNLIGKLNKQIPKTVNHWIENPSDLSVFTGLRALLEDFQKVIADNSYSAIIWGLSILCAEPKKLNETDQYALSSMLRKCSLTASMFGTVNEDEAFSPLGVEFRNFVAFHLVELQDDPSRDDVKVFLDANSVSVGEESESMFSVSIENEEDDISSCLELSAQIAVILNKGYDKSSGSISENRLDQALIKLDALIDIAQKRTWSVIVGHAKQAKNVIRQMQSNGVIKQKQKNSLAKTLRYFEVWFEEKRGNDVVAEIFGDQIDTLTIKSTCESILEEIAALKKRIPLIVEAKDKRAEKLRVEVRTSFRLISGAAEILGLEKITELVGLIWVGFETISEDPSLTKDNYPLIAYSTVILDFYFKFIIHGISPEETNIQRAISSWSSKNTLEMKKINWEKDQSSNESVNESNELIKLISRQARGLDINQLADLDQVFMLTEQARIMSYVEDWGGCFELSAAISQYVNELTISLPFDDEETIALTGLLSSSLITLADLLKEFSEKGDSKYDPTEAIQRLKVEQRRLAGEETSDEVESQGDTFKAIREEYNVRIGRLETEPNTELSMEALYVESHTLRGLHLMAGEEAGAEVWANIESASNLHLDKQQTVSEEFKKQLQPFLLTCKTWIDARDTINVTGGFKDFIEWSTSAFEQMTDNQSETEERSDVDHRDTNETESRDLEQESEEEVVAVAETQERASEMVGSNDLTIHEDTDTNLPEPGSEPFGDSQSGAVNELDHETSQWADAKQDVAKDSESNEGKHEDEEHKLDDNLITPEIQEAPRSATDSVGTVVLDADIEIQRMMADIFRSEVENTISDIKEAFYAWQTDKNNENCLSVKRGMHTLKGNAKGAGYYVLGDLSHSFESIFEDISIGLLEEVEDVEGLVLEAFRYIDHAAGVIRKTGEELPRPHILMNAIDTVLEGDSCDIMSVRESLEKLISKGLLSENSQNDQSNATTPDSPREVADDKKSSVNHSPKPEIQEDKQKDSNERDTSEPGLSIVKTKVTDEKNNNKIVKFDDGKKRRTYKSPTETYQERESQSGSILTLGDLQKSWEKNEPKKKKSSHSTTSPKIKIEEALLDTAMSSSSEVVSLTTTLIDLMGGREYAEENQKSVFDMLQFNLSKMRVLKNRIVPLREIIPGEVNFLVDELLEQQERAFDAFSKLEDFLRNDIKALTLQKTLTQKAKRKAEHIQRKLTSARLVPFENLSPTLKRVADSTAKELGKNVKLSIVGGDTLVDKNVVDSIADALNHVIRNSIDHGIESADIRKKAGKSAVGNIGLKVRRTRGKTAISIEDDGAGINKEEIIKKAVELKFIRPDETIADEQAYMLITKPGFSTARDRLSAISGRGIGMDIVRAAVDRLDGILSIKSEEGVGTLFTLEIPTDVSSNQALMCRTGSVNLAIQTQNLVTLKVMTPAQVEKVCVDGKIHYKNKPYHYIKLSQLIGLPNECDSYTDRDKHIVSLFYCDVGSYSLAVECDEIDQIRQVLQKPISIVSDNPKNGIVGYTEIHDDKLAYIVDLPIMANYNLVLVDNRLVVRNEASLYRATEKPLIMVVDDSSQYRMAMAQYLNLMGYEVETSSNGLEALNRLADKNQKLPEAIFTDAEMPKMNGFQFVESVKCDDRIKHLPMVMITTLSNEESKQRAREGGVSMFLNKPIQKEDLQSILARIFPGI